MENFQQVEQEDNHVDHSSTLSFVDLMANTQSFDKGKAEQSPLPQMEIVGANVQQAATHRTEADLRGLINQLDSANYRTRESAHSDIRRDGIRALPSLLRATGDANSGLSAEGSRRVELLIKDILNPNDGSGAGVAKVVNNLGSSDRQLAAGARQVFDRLSMDDLLHAAADPNSGGLTDAMREAIKSKDANWKETLQGYLGGNPETAGDFRRAMAAAEMLGNHSHNFNLSLLYGRQLLEQNNPQEASRTLDRSLNALEKLLQVPNKPEGILHAIDFRQQIQDHLDHNKLPQSVRQILERHIQRAESLEQRFRKMYQN